MKILVRATNWVGDAIFSIPALEAIRRRWRSAEIVVLGQPWMLELYRGQALADRLLEFDHLGRHRGPLGRERLAHELRREEFASAVLLQNAFDAAWIAWRARIPERIGYARDARAPLLTRAIRPPQPGETPPHEAYYYLELLRRAGWIDALPEVNRVCLRVDAVARGRAEATLLRAGARTDAWRVAMAPGAAYGTAKRWPAERFAALADRLMAEFDADVIFFGTAGERALAARIAAAMRRRPISLVGVTPIGDLPAQLAACHLFIGNDAGATHVAAAVGLPVVAIFGPTDPVGSAPVTPQLSVLQQPVSCSPCFLRDCPVDHRCMTRVNVDAVVRAAQAWATRSASHG